MGKFIQRSAETIKTAFQGLEVVAVEGVETPVVMFLKDVKERIIEVPRDVITYVDREVEVIREVPITVEKEVIKYVDRVETKFVDVEKIVEKIVHIPVDKIREVEKRVVTTVHKIPNWMWYVFAFETLTICLLVIK